MSTQKKFIYEWVRPFVIPFLGAVSAYLVLFTRLDARVAALESFDAENKPLVERFLQLEERDKQLVDDVATIKQDVKLLLQRSR